MNPSMDFGFSDSCNQKGEKNGLNKKWHTEKSLLLFRFFYSWQSVWSPLAISYIEYINHCSLPSSFLPLFHITLPDNYFKMHSDRWCLFTELPIRLYSLLPCIQTLHSLTSTYLYLLSTTTPYSTPWSSQIGSLFVLCALGTSVLAAILSACNASYPHLCLLKFDSWLNAQCKCLLFCGESILWPSLLETTLSLNS